MESFLGGAGLLVAPLKMKLEMEKALNFGTRRRSYGSAGDRGSAFWIPLGWTSGLKRDWWCLGDFDG
jgi:hypothetical protein